ncbi:hypothetical protein KEM56_003030 [Ascosphaera pollenicola]|nr:hypothetical protein KEM56_003030 [Ascosphaera pollenicola]
MERLPPEIVYDIAGYAHSASDLCHLAQASRRMHDVISTDNYRSFQGFLRSRYPTAAVPPIWKDAVHALVSRENAFKLRAVQARMLKIPPHIHHGGSNKGARRNDRPTLGFRPPIDSYELWRSGSWNDRKEVMAYGAGADLVIRIKNNEHPLSKGTEWEPWHREKDEAAWILHGSPEMANSLDDITGVHLLPQLNTTSAFEEVIFARRRGCVERVVLNPSDDAVVKKKYDTGMDSFIDRTDIDNKLHSTLAVTMDRGPILLFNVNDDRDIPQPFARIDPERRDGPSRPLTSRLFNEESIAVWSHRLNNAINLFHITESGVREVQSFECGEERKNVYEIVGMDPAWGRRPFLSGWQNGTVKLHDIRVPHAWVGCFEDSIRFDPVYCIQPIGSMHFLTGIGSEGIVQLYDFRQPKSAVSQAQVPAQADQAASATRPTVQPKYAPKKDGFTMFVSPTVGRLADRAKARYRGPIYTLSQPSSSSSSVWVGIESGICRLDFVSSHDLAGPSSSWYSANCQIDPYKWDRKGPYRDLVHFELAGYENKDAGRPLVQPSYRSQMQFHTGMKQARTSRAAIENDVQVGRGGGTTRREWMWKDAAAKAQADEGDDSSGDEMVIDEYL